MLCAYGFSEMCVTPHIVVNASAKVKELNDYLRGPWNGSFVNFTLQLVHAIVRINETRVTPIDENVWWQAMSKIAGWVSRWSGSISLLILCILGLGLGFFMMYRWHLQFS